MISPVLLARVACPVCLEAAGCDACSRIETGHASCLEEYAVRAACACGGPDKVRLEPSAEALACPCCGESYPLRVEAGYADLLPRASMGRTTKYADAEFQEHAKVVDSPPVLSARVKIDMMLRMLGPRPGETILDLGCGAGKMAAFTASRGSAVVGLDMGAFFLPRAAAEVDLVVGDLRRLPFRKASFSYAYSLDVLEHLEEPGVTDVLVETRRVLGPSGALFVYTHALEPGVLPFAAWQRAVNRLARALGSVGLLDWQREVERKSDHVNAIRSHAHFESLCAAAGLFVAERRYYNVFFKPLIEDVCFRVWDHVRARSPRDLPPERAPTVQVLSVRPPPGKLQLFAAALLTAILELDVLLFSRFRTGPFFARILARPRTAPPTRGDATARSPGSSASRA